MPSAPLSRAVGVLCAERRLRLASIETGPDALEALYARFRAASGRIRCQGRHAVFDVGLSAVSGRADGPFVTSANK